MTDLLTAIGLMLVLEGAAYALFPEHMRRMMMAMMTMPSPHIRTTGLVCAILGALLIAAIRGI